ncbi:MAG: discoidin domain-containing protein, partial [Bacteroidales bacterium]|nr:discoidin domain-containing protein [Bacteroidales bacterium]
WTWTINAVESEMPYIAAQTAGNYVIAATVAGEIYTKTLFVSPTLPNLVEDYCTAYASSQTNAAINVLEEGTTSRWESVLEDAAYAGDINDQWIYVDLIRECQITSVEINWEAASASSYDIQFAPQGAVTEDVQVFYNAAYQTVSAPVEWTTVASDGASGAGTVTTPVEGTARYVRIKCNKRATQYAYSIFEIKIHGLETDDVVEFYENLALSKTATCSSSTGNNAYFATDGDAGSRWESQFLDDQWLYVDLGKDYNFDKVVVSWEAAKAKTYKIQVAKDGAAMATYTGKMSNAEGSTEETFEAVASSEWADLATVSSNGDGGEEITTSVTGNGRYVRILTTERATVYGSSIYELEVWGVSRTIGGSATDVQGMEISASAETINEDETATFTASVYNIDGTTVNTAVVWTTDNGTITADGVLTPEKYGTATVTATSVDGELTASKTVTVNEVIKLASLTIDPEELSMVAGDQADFSMEGYNQFGGLYDLSGNMTATVKDANGNVSNGISVDVDNMIVTANTQGTYTVTFTIGKVSQDWTVKVVPIVEINLALGQEATAGSTSSGYDASALTDGNLTTRWQAAPGGEQWVMIELDNTYAVNRIVTTWEAAYATKYHIEVSIDGENWSTLVANSVAPTAGAGNGQELTAAAPGAARYVKLVADELVGDAVTWGMSIFEIEVYGTARFDNEDTTAPVFTFKNIGKSGETAVTAGAIATDASGYVSYVLTLEPLTAVGAEGYATGCNAYSGDAISLTISDIAAGSYVATLTATDPYGNSTSYSETVTITAQSIIGVNLALNRPVTGSDAQNATPISNTVDGDVTTGWEAYHITTGTACDYYLQVELDGVYNLTSVVIVSNDNAYPMNGTLQFSEDGENWTTTVSANRTATGTSTHTLNNVVAKYVRYNITSKNLEYGIWIHEFEVYGDSRLLGIASVNGTDVALSGTWDADRFAAIDDLGYTAYDFTNVVVPTAGISGLSVKNPNAIIYKAEDQKIAGTGLNVVEMTADGAVAGDLNFMQGYNFNAAVDIRATGTVTVGFPTFAGKGMIVLPFAYSPADGQTVSRFVSYSATQACFTPNAGELAANTPAMLVVETPSTQSPMRAATSLTISVANTTVEATPELMIAGGALQGTYLNVSETSNLTFDASENKFTSSVTSVPSFSASLVTGDSNSRAIDSTSTIVLGPLADLDPETPIDVYSIDGRLLRRNVELRNATRGLATGFYLVGGQKLLVK